MRMKRSAMRAGMKWMLAMVIGGGVLTGCGDSTPQPIAVSIAPSEPGGIDQGQTKGLTATVANDSSNAGVSWTLSGAGGLTGSTTGATTYNAPATVAENTVVTITATSVADATKTASVTITVTPPPTITTTSLANGTVGTAYTATLAASGGVTPLTWSVTTGTLPAGLTLNGSTGAITGTPTAAGTANVTIQVADSGSPSLTNTKDLSLQVDTAALAIGTTSLANATVNVAYNATVQATGGTPPYTFSIGSGSLPGGMTIDAGTGAISGTATETGTAEFTVHVADTSEPVQTADQALSITVTAGGANDNLLNGTYAVNFSGWDTDGSVVMAGSFAADGAGSVTGGSIDVTRITGPASASITGGSYTIGEDRRGTVTLTSELGTWTYRVSVDATGQKARCIEFDDSGTTGAGTIKKQDTEAFGTALGGSYAFGLAGFASADTRTATVGSFTASSGSVSSGGSIDVSQSGVASGQITITGGAVGAADSSTGRGTLTITAAIPGVPGTLSYVYYEVSATELFVVNVNPSGDEVPRLGGTALKQTAPGGGFTLGSFNGTSVFYTSGYDISHSQTNVGIGVVTANGTGTITSASLDQNADGTINTGTSNGTYTMTASGRGVVAITGLREEVVQLVSASTGFLLEGTTNDPGNDVGLGFFEPQTSTATPAGTYVEGSVDPSTNQASDTVGTLAAGATTPPLGGTVDFSDWTANVADIAYTGTFTTAVDASGRGIASIVQTGDVAFPLTIRVISATKFVAIVSDAEEAQTSVLIFEK